MSDAIRAASTSDMDAIDVIVNAWCEADLRRALIPIDREIIDKTRTIRALVCEEAACRGDGHELLNAAARLGRMIGEQGGSPTLLAATADGLATALPDHAGKFDLPGVRVALAEGFAAALLDLAKSESLASWEPPNGIVRIDADTVAIAAGFPDDDPELLEAWAARVTQWVLADKKRNAIVAGRTAAAHALVDALTLVGVTLLSGDEGAVTRGHEKRTSWLPWRRGR